jgi:aspartate racemase
MEITPPILISSIDLKKMLDLIAANQLAKVTESLVGEVQKLARAGADFGLLAANTTHIVFDYISRPARSTAHSWIRAISSKAIQASTN